MFIVRKIQPLLKKYLGIFPVIGITGPRQSGKSTMLKHVLPDYRYVTFDDYQTQTLFREDPVGFMKIYSTKVIFDEVQKAPSIFDAIKLHVDQNRNIYGNFILTGSSQFSMIKGIKESLAGRIGMLRLLPFQRSEIPTDLHEESIYAGSYPEVVLRRYKYSDEWYSSYIETYINKDIKDISNIGNLRDFRRFASLLAARIAQPLNMSSYAKELGVTVPTIKSWVSVLESSYIVYLLQAFHSNFGKRLIKSPKIYFYDTGLVSYMTGISSKAQYELGPMSGQIFENYIVTEVLKFCAHYGAKSECYFYRDHSQDEVDLIIDIKTHRIFIEIKKSNTFKLAYLKTIQNLMQEGDKGFLVYSGETMKLSENLFAINYNEFLISLEALLLPEGARAPEDKPFGRIRVL